MADRDTIIEAMARAIATALRATPEDYYWVDYTDEATAAYDAALPLIRNAALEEAADEAFCWDTGRQASEAIRALKDTP